MILQKIAFSSLYLSSATSFLLNPQKDSSKIHARDRSFIYSSNLFASIEQDETKLDRSNMMKDGWEDVVKEEAANEEMAKSKKAFVGPGNVLIYDTSLRDGTQGESVSVSCDDKIKIANRLSSFGVDYIECGWPGSNPKDAEFFSRAQEELDEITKTKLVAFGSTRRKSVNCEEDGQIKALIESGAPTVCIVAKGNLWQVTDIIRASAEENLQMIEDSVKYLTQMGRRVFVDLEHFFDGYKFDSEYTLKCCEAAVKAGAEGLVLCDTNGGSMPWEVEEITKAVVDKFGGNNNEQAVTVGIHCHNDCGMAVANSLSSCRGGAGMVQGTINGIGERTGNADLCSIIPSLALHMSSKVTCTPNLKEISMLSRFVDEVLNRNPNPSAPYVGTSAFAHKGGLHVAAMERDPMSYQHIDPSIVGNEKRILISELSGRQNIMGKMTEMGIDLGDKTSDRAISVLNRVKDLESIGYTFEGADATVRLMILHATDTYCQPFQVLDYSAQVFDMNMGSSSRSLFEDKAGNTIDDDELCVPSAMGPTARATVKVRAFNPESEKYEDHLEVSDGNGPVDALAKALKRGLVPSYPNLDDIELVDYKVRILDPENATGAVTRVMIEFRDSQTQTTWTTVSVGTNVISASLNALLDGFEYTLLLYKDQEMCFDLWPTEK